MLLKGKDQTKTPMRTIQSQVLCTKEVRRAWNKSQKQERKDEGERGRTMERGQGFFFFCLFVFVLLLLLFKSTNQLTKQTSGHFC